jgi:hypothetical protein
MKGIKSVLFGLVVAAVLMGSAQAQTGTSRITGTVTDPSGAVLPGAKVTAKNEATGVTYTAQTSGAGTYSFESLPVGSYEIKVEAQGFRTFASAQNVLTVGQPLVVDVPMQVGAQSEVVSVTGSYEKLTTSNAAVGDVIERKAIVDLPLNGRNPLALITLQPGLIQRSTNGTGSGTHVNGSRDRSHNVTIDGIDANEPSVPNPQSNVYRLNPDNVQEYRVTTHNATAEYGRNSGAQVAVATRAGTNEYHGTVYEFFRNTALNANEFYNNAQNVAKPDLKLNQFGGEFGGPIIKNKTHFFASYQNQRIKVSQPITSTVYTASARQGLFRYFVADPASPLQINGQNVTRNSPLLVDPASGAVRSGVPACSATVTVNCIATFNMYANDPARIGADPKIKQYLDQYPAPNTYVAGDGLNLANFVWNAPSSTEGPNWLARIDHQFNDRHGIFGRWLQATTDTRQGDLLNGRPQRFPNFPPLGEVFRNSKNLALNYRATLSNNIVNEFTAGFARFNFFFTFAESNPDFPNIVPYDFGNISDAVLNIPHTQRALTTFQFIDNLSIVKGSHVIRAGTNIRFLQHNDSRGLAGGFNLAPSLTFSATVRPPVGFNTPAIGSATRAGMNSNDNVNLLQTINELLGIPARLSQGFISDPTSDAFLPTGNIYNSGIRYKQYNFYGQDEWKVTPRLTLNYGVRLEVVAPPTEAAGRVFTPNRLPDRFEASNLVSFVKKDSWYDNTAWGVAPRFSFAYNFRDKTVVRAGYGMAFDPISTFQVTAIAGKTPGLVTQSIQNAATFTGNENKRIGQGFPLDLAPPTAKASSFYTPRPALQGVAPSIGLFDPKLQLPTVHEWNLNIQRELPWGVVTEVGYIGKRGTRLLRAYNLNQSLTNHDGLVQSFNAAKQNLARNCNPDGTGCPAGVTATPVGILLQLSTAAFLNSATSRTDLQRNALGNLTNRIDQTFDLTTKGVAANFFRPNPQFSEIFYIDSGGDSYYHSLQVSARKRFEHGLAFGLAYTFGKSIDNQSVDPVGATSGGRLSTTNSSTPTDIRDWRTDRSLSDFDRRHVLNINAIYDLPFGKGRKFLSGTPGVVNHIIGGWGVNGIFLKMSGQPFNINSGILTNHNSHVSFAQIIGPRPKIKLQEVQGFIGPSVLSLNDLASFTFPDPGTNGNQGRNTFIGLGYANFDFGVLKRFDLTERFKLQFRAEFFNALNHPNFETPRDASVGSPTITSSNFGRTCCGTASTPSATNVIATGESARVVQFALKLTF